MMYEIIVKGNFSAAHKIENYPGNCANLHGHNWSVEARFTCHSTNDMGLAFDFREAKKILDETLSIFDHSFLNENPIMNNFPPTSENLAKTIFKAITQRTPPGVVLSKVTLWESKTTGVSYSE